MNFLLPKHVDDLDNVILNSISVFKFDPTILEEKRGAVFYTDGGYRAAMHYREAPPAVGGYGVFGYIYTEAETKVGHGCQGFTPSLYGLVQNVNHPIELIDRTKPKNHGVSVLAYIQMMDGDFKYASNNVAEVLATTNAFDLALKLDLDRICVKTDSRYVLQGLFYCKKWSENGWRKADGEQVANRELWESIYKLYNELLDKGVIIDLMWIKGHSDSVGNCYADALATKSMISLINGKYPGMLEFHDPKGFWSPRIDVNPLLLEKHVVIDGYTANDGRIQCAETNRVLHVYRLGSLGDDIDEYTKITSTKVLAAVAIPGPEPVLEALSSVARSANSEGNFVNENSVFVGRLDIIQKPSAYTEIEKHGYTFLRRDMFNNQFSLHNKTLILEEINPPLLGEHTIHQAYNHIVDLLACCVTNTPARHTHFHLHDVTDQIFSCTQTKNKFIYKAKDNIDKQVTVQTEAMVEGGIRNVNLKLVTGLHTPKYRVLNKIASPETKVYVVTWPVSSKAYRHATLIKSEHGIGIWSGAYSNQEGVS